jgi:hypothetical protein
MRTLLIGGGLIAAVAVIVVVALLSIGGGNSLAEAAENLKGENVRMQVTLGFVEEGEDVSMTGIEVQTADNSRSRYDAKTTVEGLDEPLDQTVLAIGDDVYVRTPAFDEFMPEGKRWVHMVDRTASLTTMSMADHAAFLADADNVEDKGETTIRGRRVTHYQGDVNIRDLAQETGGSLERYWEDNAGDRDLFIPIEAWIGDGGRPERIAVNLPNNSITVDILEFGVPVEVEAPPENQLISEAEFNRIAAE